MQAWTGIVGRSAVALACVSAGASNAYAQAFDGFAGQMGMSNMHNSVLQRSIARKSAESQGAIFLRPNNAAPALSSSKLTFAVSKPLRQRNYANFVERSRRVDPAGAANLAATLRSDPVMQMGPELAKFGLRTNNVADAYAVYWIEAWEAAQGVTAVSSRETAQAVKAQAANGILATPEFLDATDAQKQEFAEALLVQALLIGAMREQNKGNPALLRQIAAAVRQGARASGLDLDAMTLTPQGFVPAQSSGAVSSTPGETPRAFAAAEAKSDGPSYALIAVAGGAGLGAAFLLGEARVRKG